MTSPQPRTFGQLLKHHRVAAGLTQEALAERAGLSARGISDMERGRRHAPYQDTIRRLARALHLSAAERAQLEDAAHRRSAPRIPPSPSASVSDPSTSPEMPTAGASLVVTARSNSAPPDAVGQARHLGWQMGAWVARRAQPLPAHTRDKLVPRLLSMVLVSLLLSGTLVSTGVTAQRPRIGGGRLCLATDFPTTDEEGPYSGLWGKSLEHAVQLAVQQNRSLGSGYTLEVIPYVEVPKAIVQKDPKRGAQNVTNMVNTPCIVGMVGPTASRVAVAEMPVTAQNGLAMISPANTMPALTLRLYAGNYGVDFDQLHPPGKKTNYFRVIASDVFQGVELAEFTIRPPPGGLGARSAFVIDDHTANEALAGGFTQEFLARGGTIVGTASIPFGGTPRLAEQAARIAASKPDVVVYAGTSDEGGGLLKARLVQVGYTGSFVSGDGIAEIPEFVAEVGTAAANDIFAIESVSNPAKLTSIAAKAFVRDCRAHYPGQILDGYVANAYDAAMVLIMAIRRLIQAGQEVTRDAVLDQVQNIQNVGVTGEISFDHNGDRTHGIFSVYTVRDGRWVWMTHESI